MLEIDGDQGEGGGQILRTALTLSLCRQRPFRIVNIRARRSRPGLRPQHLMAVQAAAQVGRAEVAGAEVGSAELTFTPRGITGGDYRFDIGSAGSTTLVLQTVLLPLLAAASPSRLTLIGGTHNPMAPPVEFIEQAFLPLLARMGARVSLTLERAGFYPRGGGIVQVAIEPSWPLAPLLVRERGELQGLEALALLGHLPGHIAERELAVLAAGLGLRPEQQRVREVECYGQGNALLLALHAEHLTELFTRVGERGVPAETVAGQLLAEVKHHLACGVPVGPYLADQLLLPLALAGGGEFITSAPDLHTPTNIAVIRQFLDVPIACQPLDGRRWRVRVGEG